MEHKVAPPLQHALVLFDRHCTPRLRDIPLQLLPERWRELMLEHQNNNWLDSVYTPRPKIMLPQISSLSTPDLGPKRAKQRRKNVAKKSFNSTEDDEPTAANSTAESSQNLTDTHVVSHVKAGQQQETEKPTEQSVVEVIEEVVEDQVCQF